MARRGHAVTATIRDGHITDPAAVIRELEDLYVAKQVLDFKNQPLRPLRDTDKDQEAVGDNPYWDIVRRLPLEPERIWTSEVQVESYVMKPGFRRGYVISRDRLVKTYAWAIPTPSDIAWITGVLDGHGVVEVGAGTGYWAWQLSQANVDVLAYDAEPMGNKYCAPLQYHPVHAGGPEKAADDPTRALFLCWPPYDDPCATDALNAYAGDTLIYIGEGSWGCTGDERFHELLDQEWQEIGTSPGHVTFSGIHCWVTAYQRGKGDAASYQAVER